MRTAKEQPAMIHAQTTSAPCPSLELMYRDAHASAYEAYQKGDRRTAARWTIAAIRIRDDAQQAGCTWIPLGTGGEPSAVAP
jgi:hypothetical protein